MTVNISKIILSSGNEQKATIMEKATLKLSNNKTSTCGEFNTGQKALLKRLTRISNGWMISRMVPNVLHKRFLIFVEPFVFHCA